MKDANLNVANGFTSEDFIANLEKITKLQISVEFSLVGSVFFVRLGTSSFLAKHEV